MSGHMRPIPSPGLIRYRRLRQYYLARGLSPTKVDRILRPLRAPNGNG